MDLLNLIYQLTIAFCFGGINSLIISMIKSKGIEQNFLDALLNPLKKSIFVVSLIALILNVYLIGTGNVTFLILIYIANTCIFGIYLGNKWKMPSVNQVKIMQVSGMVSLILWYIIIILNFLSL
jgi:hypothetical protein